MDAPLLVNPQWLHDHLADPGVQVIENAWIAEAYEKAHISGALRTPWHPHLKHFTAAGERTHEVMTTGDFSTLCRDLGLRRDRHYVIYDDFYGLFAARFWWVGRYFGLSNFSVLDGSWRGWLERGYPVSCRLETPVPGSDIIPSRTPSCLWTGTSCCTGTAMPICRSGIPAGPGSTAGMRRRTTAGRGTFPGR